MRIFIALFALYVPLQAQDMSVPVPTQWTFFQKILAFRYSIGTPRSAEPVLAIVYQSTFRPSLDVRNELRSILDEQQTAIGGTPVRIIEIDLTKTENPGAMLAAGKVTMAYIAPLRAYDVATILRDTREQKILTLSGVPAYVTAGVSVGLDNRGGRPEILINRTAAQLEGSDFRAQLLKLATIVY